MNNEISEEAKKALADNARRKAFDRLEKDGAHSTAALQRRVRALAHERNIPPADYAKLMYKRPNIQDIGAFCEKHGISYDWILGGELPGLQRMTREYKDRAGGRPEGKWVNFLRVAIETIPPNQRRVAIEAVIGIPIAGQP
jgi:hypothetical protein